MRRNLNADGIPSITIGGTGDAVSISSSSQGRLELATLDSTAVLLDPI